MANQKGISDYKAILNNILEDVTPKEKKEIKLILSSLDALVGNETGFYKEADKLIRKYRSDFFTN